MPTVLLFDVDGTLITTGGVGRRAIERALGRHGAAASATFSFAGMTDRAIVRAALGNATLEPSEARIDAVIAFYLEVLEEEVSAAPASGYRILPGMLEALDAARARVGVAVGLGTGNVERGARIKLGRVGISDRFAFGGFGCDAEDRALLVRAGAERGALHLGAPLSECRVVVIGDTPRDVAAAKAVGAESIALAIGGTSERELAESEPTHLFESLASAGAIEALLDVG